MKVGDKVLWGEQAAEISEILEFSDFKYRIEWRNPYGEYRTRCVKDHEIIAVVLGGVTPPEANSIAYLQSRVAELEAEKDRMLRERSGRRYGDFIEYPESKPFAFQIEWGEEGYPIEIVLSMMDADDRAAFVGRVSGLLYRYMGDSPHAQAMAIMKDLTGEPS